MASLGAFQPICHASRRAVLCLAAVCVYSIPLVIFLVTMGSGPEGLTATELLLALIGLLPLPGVVLAAWIWAKASDGEPLRPLERLATMGYLALLCMAVLAAVLLAIGSDGAPGGGGLRLLLLFAPGLLPALVAISLLFDIVGRRDFTGPAAMERR